MSNTPSFTPSKTSSFTPSFTPTLITSNTPSNTVINTPSVFDDKLYQIQALQQQLLQMQQYDTAQTQLQQQQLQQQLQMHQLQLNDLETSTKVKTYQEISTMNLKNMCGNMKSTGDINVTTNNIGSVSINELCQAINNNGEIKLAIGYSTSEIKNTKITDDDTTLPYCNKSAISNTSYQTEQCVCNQMSKNSVLHKASVKTGGLLGIGATTTTGYYCSIK
jgi:hypothetical protein